MRCVKTCLTALILTLMLGVGFAGQVAAKDQNLDYERLSARLDHLQKDPVLSQYALSQRSHARDTLERFKNADKDERAHWLYMAKRRIDLAWAAAQLADARHKHTQLRHEHDQIMLTATRQEAARVRRQLERLRVQNMATQEAAERLRKQGEASASEAEQARQQAQQAKQLAETRAHAASLARKQAKLAEKAARTLRAAMENLKARPGPKGMEMVLGGTAFASGSATLQPAVTKNLGKLVQFVQSEPSKPVLVEGYTDSSGSNKRNLELSRERAAAVRDALVAAGVKASRIHVKGYGEANPVASNDSASGRARNRRVIVVLKD